MCCSGWSEVTCCLRLRHKCVPSTRWQTHHWRRRMGREATVDCQWGDEAGQCKVLLESRELIVRGAIRLRVAIASLTHVFAEENRLYFRVGADEVFLDLGSKAA